MTELIDRGELANAARVRAFYLNDLTDIEELANALSGALGKAEPIQELQTAPAIRVNDNHEVEGGTVDNRVRKIRELLTPAEMWGQLAEECAEMAQAALKMQRTCLGNNKPRKDFDQCVADLIEEHSDVAVCFEILDWHDKNARTSVRDRKLDRWLKVLEEAAK